MSFFLFLASGAVSTLLDIGIFAILLKYVDGSIAYAASYSICIVLRYAFDAKKTFNADAYSFRHFLLYFSANFLLMLLGLLVFHLLAAGMSELYAKVASIPPVTLAGFLLMRHWVFRKPAPGKEECNE